MNKLQTLYERKHGTSWINADIYPDGTIYTKEYTVWLEKKVFELMAFIKSDAPMQYSFLVMTRHGDTPFYTDYFDFESDFKGQAAMIVFDLVNDRYTTDGVAWQPIATYD